MRFFLTKQTLLALVLLFLAGCASPRSFVDTSLTSANTLPSPSTVVSMPLPDPDSFAFKGFFHTVKRGETLYRLSKLYQTPLKDMIRANSIRNVNRIRVGQRLLIPGKGPSGASQFQPRIPLYANNHWKYIVIHHTATHQGNKETLDRLHKKRGFSELGYHFVVDNGTENRALGEIEIGSRWYKQKRGAHAKTSNMNHEGIGVALVGNFSEDSLSNGQMKSAVYLVNVLRRYYKIPEDRILGHRHVPGAATECPGKLFPWSRFKKMLDA
jgi:N-acetylmuramoyl-L-alanine amidase